MSKKKKGMEETKGEETRRRKDKGKGAKKVEEIKRKGSRRNTKKR